MRCYIILSIILLSSLIIKEGYGQLVQSDYECLLNVYTKLGFEDIESYPIGGDGNREFCKGDDFFIYCKDNYVNYLFTPQNTSDVVVPNDYNCFSKLEHLRIYGGVLEKDFIYKLKPLKSLEIDSCYNMQNISYPIVGIDEFYLNTSFIDFKTDIKFSNLNNYFVVFIDPVAATIDISLVNDLTSPKQFDSLSTVTSNIPSLTNVIINNLWLSLRQATFIQESWEQLKTFRDLQNFYIENDFPIDFPIELFNVSGSSLNYLCLVSNLKKPSSYINLQLYSNFIEEIEIANAGNNFNINGDVPFSSLGGLRHLTLDGGNFDKLTSFFIFSDLQTLYLINSNLNRSPPTIKRNNFENLNLTGNKLTGPLDESYCTFNNKIRSVFDLTNNLLTAPAPGCFLCYPSTFGKSFDAYMYLNAPACEITGNVYLDKARNKIILQGKNLGFSDLLDLKFYKWDLVVPSFRLEISTFLYTKIPNSFNFTFENSAIPKKVISFPYLAAVSPPPCYRNCTDKEFCNLKTARCFCISGWTGEDCEIPDHYASATSIVDESGGKVIIYGVFGTVHKELSVYFGALNCNVTSITNNTIECNIGPGTGTKSIYINQNNINWVGKDLFTYIKKVKQCLNNCGSHGRCIESTGQCKCESGWTGLDCQSKETPGSSTTVDNNGTTIINNEHTSYQIMIIKLLELDIKGTVLGEYDLFDKWVLEKSNGSFSRFTQTIEQSPYNCTLAYTIEEVKEESGKEYDFADYKFTLEKGSIKISASISNYQYISSLSTLQLHFESSVTSLSQKDDCNYNGETNLENKNNDELNFITIKKDEKLLYGRFLNRALSDGRSTSITSTQIPSNSTDSIIIGLNLPHCTECVIDPDFSVLITSDFKTCSKDSNTSNSKPKYLIPVVVVCSIVGVALIVSLSYLVYRKKFVENQLSKKIKSIEMR
ncbi:hypothetical protein DICPUDRAFT_77552 [Dictyostelium purpureum]|uniref:EGF-like domain-containing protein n=1 Tax=Dictyostelium purpureum TaxID=5786 RepID=F0ZGY5_DICPU|nr:uncharacterized protein DICPUDRAFT_77552 [Dictyostelium purpureum]EGC36795.1 hypothetical protein DICPUDRAFT_77552 [Dictyostelium purpureum]|eukprot:XP_003286666.1 hypothetical protein DICPUDRAFT_77552 [Dictyostelium purpureum]